MDFLEFLERYNRNHVIKAEQFGLEKVPGKMMSVDHTYDTKDAEGYINDKYREVMRGDLFGSHVVQQKSNIEKNFDICREKKSDKEGNEKLIDYLEGQCDSLRKELKTKNKLIERMFRAGLDEIYTRRTNSNKDKTKSPYRNISKGLEASYTKGLSVEKGVFENSAVNITYVFELFGDTWEPVQYYTNFPPYSFLNADEVKMTNDKNTLKSKRISKLNPREIKEKSHSLVNPALDFIVSDASRKVFGDNMTVDNTLLNDFTSVNRKPNGIDPDSLKNTGKSVTNKIVTNSALNTLILNSEIMSFNSTSGCSVIEKIAKKLSKLASKLKKKKLTISNSSLKRNVVEGNIYDIVFSHTLFSPLPLSIQTNSILCSACYIVFFDNNNLQFRHRF